MDKDGFYPEHGCKNCGKPLRGQDSGFPAELYAGTYNGLCYGCTDAPIFEENYSKVSGARVWNHPPHCPAWRRDREIFYGFDDCDCNHGRRHVSRSDPQGGPYGIQCKECWERHQNHPLVKALNQRQAKDLWIKTVIFERAQMFFDEQAPTIEGDPMEYATALKDKAVECFDNETDPPAEWPALKAADRKRLLKRAPQGMHDLDLVAVLVRYGGNPRKRRKTCPKKPSE